MHSLLQSLRYTTRLLRKSPGFTVTAVVFASSSLFQVTNLPFILGRPFGDDEDKLGGPLVVVIGNGRDLSYISIFLLIAKCNGNRLAAEPDFVINFYE
jgi:hypothetical protein